MLDLTKALRWYFVVETVCRILYHETHMMLINLLDSTFILTYCYYDRNIQHHIRPQFLHAVFGNSGSVARYSIFPCPWTGHPHASKASKSEVDPLG
jgi:hypothetical protein